MKSLDALISYLLEEVALCGKQGAGPSDVFKHVTAFYAKPSGLDSDGIVEADVGECTGTVVIDRQFQEQVWKWLVSHPECRVGTRGQGGRRSLSEVEAPNHALQNHEAVAKQVLPELSVLQKDSRASRAQEDTNRTSPLIPESSDRPAQSQSINERVDRPRTVRSAKLGVSDRCVDRSHDADGEVRVYANEECMWHALTGHGVDYSKIPPLDFTCLSIIAAAGPKGIIQQELVKLSDQDKRSVPRRTQKLFENGYIAKTPILSGSARTSICTLKRFVTAPNARKPEKDAPHEEPDLDIDSQVIFQQCFPDGAANLYMLLRNIFDLLNRLKIITLEDLRMKLGVKGHQWERRVLASTLRKLEAVGCVKQVRARAHSLGDGTKYFRCLKLIREPGDNESQLLCGVSHVDLRFLSIGQGGDLDSESEVEDDDQVQQTLSLVGLDNKVEGTALQELRRPVPQWTGNGCISNFFYHLIQRAGTLGLSTMNIKDQALGRLVSRPVENQLTRIVDHWQVSQPTHLRHLAIIRDTAMVKKKTHYIHYTYDNFQKLVENGDATWEAVSIPGNDNQNRQQPAFAMDLNADLDEYGFPDIPSTLFQGRHNDATLSQCVNAVVVAKASVSKKDPVVKELSDGTYEVHHAAISHWMPRKFALNPTILNPSMKACNAPRLKGRPRKTSRTDLPRGLTLAQNSKIIQSQKAAIRYQKGKIEKEIARRIGDGEDPKSVREDIFAMVSAKYLDAGEDVPASIKELRVGDMTLSEDPTTCISLPVEPPSGKKQSRENPPTASEPAFPEYLPSVAAHTQTALMNLGFASNLVSRSSKQVSARVHKKFLLRKDSEKPGLLPKPNGSIGMTYDEQSNLIGRENCGVFVGVDALRARTPGQRGRSRKCRLAIFKSARLSEFVWFSESLILPRGNIESAPVCDESRPGPRALSPCLPISARATPEQTSPPGVESSKLFPAEKGCKNTLKSSHIAPSSDRYESLKNGSTGLNVSDQDRMPDLAAYTESHMTSCIEKNKFAVIEPGHVSQAAYEEKRCNLLGLPPNISPFTPINRSHPKFSKSIADSEAVLHIEKEKAIPLKNTSEFQISHVINHNAEEQPISHSKSSDIGMPPAPIFIKNPLPIYAQKESHDVADSRTGMEPTTLAQASPALNALPPISGGTVTDAHGGTLQTSARLKKPVTISGGSISMVRKKIIMDIMQRCGGIYSGHKELSGPFITAWTRQNKPGTPDSKTVYAAFRSLVQACKLRELKFSFQTPKGLMVTKSMITLTSIPPTDHRVTEMQQLMMACHPSPYIPEGVEILEEVRNLPVYPSRFGTNRALADLEIDNESQVRLQHKPSYVTRLETRKTAAERSRKIRQARLEAMRGKRERRIQCAKPWNRSNPVGAPRGVERLASIRRPVAIFNKDSMKRSNIGMSHSDPAYTDSEFTYLSSGVDSREDEGVGNSKEVRSLIDKRKRAPSDGYETGEIAHASRAGKIKRRRLAGQCPMIHYSKHSTHTLRQISTMMDPEQSFHAATGTFSVTFSGPKTLNSEIERLRDTRFISEGTTNFEMEIEVLLKWELAAGDFSNPAYPGWSFINHHLLRPHLTPAEMKYVLDSDFEVTFMGQPSQRINRPSGGSSIKKANTLDKAPDAKAKSTHPQLPKISRKRKRRDPTWKTRRLTALGEADTLADFSALEGATQKNQNGTRPSKLRRVRGPQKQVPMARDEEERLLAAVVAIRTITGGVEKHPDWVLIARLFQPRYSQMYIQKKWAHVLQRYRLQMDQIQANFQTKFAKAYEDNTIPTIDFDHLENYDWEWLVEWTLDNIDTSRDSLQHLPSKRSELDVLFNITASADVDMTEYFEVESSVTLPRREAVLNKVPYAYPTERNRQTPSSAGAQEVAIARTWIRANVITSAASYKPDLARAKLSVISESSVDVALQELLSARLLSQSNKGRLVPGRNYDISEYFVSRLRKKLDIAQFRRAAAFKRRLDEKFGEQTAVVIPYGATNGDMMAILNMLAFGRVTVKPKDPPMKKFGLTDGGYRTRQMDKSRMNFDVEIQKAPTYITGNPIAPIPLPPCQHLDDPMAKIPLWYDIHGQLVPIMWDMLLAATMSILAMRSSVSAAEIEQNVKPSAELWELELVLDWMVHAGAVTKTGQGGYTVTEWWWMCLDNEDLVQRSDEHAVQLQG